MQKQQGVLVYNGLSESSRVGPILRRWGILTAEN